MKKGLRLVNGDVKPLDAEGKVVQNDAYTDINADTFISNIAKGYIVKQESKPKDSVTIPKTTNEKVVGNFPVMKKQK